MVLTEIALLKLQTNENVVFEDCWFAVQLSRRIWGKSRSYLKDGSAYIDWIDFHKLFRVIISTCNANFIVFCANCSLVKMYYSSVQVKRRVKLMSCKFFKWIYTGFERHLCKPSMRILIFISQITIYTKVNWYGLTLVAFLTETYQERVGVAVRGGGGHS